jgi:hypothetical protein
VGKNTRERGDLPRLGSAGAEWLENAAARRIQAGRLFD